MCWNYTFFEIAPQHLISEKTKIIHMLCHTNHHLWHFSISRVDIYPYIDGLVQERRNSIANAPKLRHSCTNRLTCFLIFSHDCFLKCRSQQLKHWKISQNLVDYSEWWYLIMNNIWGLWCQKHVSQAGIRNYIPQFTVFNPWRSEQNGHYFADGIFKCILLKANVCIMLEISLKFIHRVHLTRIQHLFK